MQDKSTVLTGYVKTITTIWLALAALVVGFGGGVVFSAYRASDMHPVADQGGHGPAALTAQQQETLKALLDRTKADPEDVAAWTHLGHLYFDSGQPAMAIDAYETSLALDDQRPDVWTDLGVMYRRSGSPQKAVEAFDKALTLDSSHEIARFNKGVVLMHDLNDPKGALASWRELIRINPNAQTPGGQSVQQLVAEMEKSMASEQ